MKKEALIYAGLGLALFLLFIFKKKIEEAGENAIELGEDFYQWTYETMNEGFDLIYQRWASMRGIDWRLLKAISIVESSENPNAIGTMGEIGLGQIMPAVGASFGMSESDLYNPDLNIQVQSALISDYIPKYGVEGAIQCYNLGETKFRKGLRVPSYLLKVKSKYEGLGGVIA